MSAAKSSSPRLASLDQFRGYTVLGMFFVNFIGSYAAFKVGSFLPVFRHHNTYCSYADTIMPQFFFAVGFAYRLTFLRRLEELGALATVWHMIKRNAGLILLGIVWYHLEGSAKTWQQLQELGFEGFLRQAFQRGPFETLVHIGVAALWILPVIAAGPWVRIAFLLFSTGLSLVLWHEDFYRWAVLQLGLDYDQVRQALPIFPYYHWVMTRPGIDGGPLGFITWTIPMLIGSLAYDAVAADPPSPEGGARRLVRRLVSWGVVLMVLGYAISCLNRVTPPNQASLSDGVTSFLAKPPLYVVPPDDKTINVWSMVQRCASVSYLTFASGLSLALYALFVVLSDVNKFQVGIFRTLGANALAAYLIHSIVGDAIAPYAPKDAELWYVLCAFGLDLAIIYLFCRHLEKHKLYLRLQTAQQSLGDAMMQPDDLDRRGFLQTASAGAALALPLAAAAADSAKKPLALMGGKPVRTQKFSSWPIIKQNDIDSWYRVLKEGKWCRVGEGKYDNAFEKAYADLTGTRHCIATANGTSALFCALNALGIGPGDEVLVPPYTFVATINAVLLQHAVPVFVDTDRETSQIDARKIEAAITPRTACILPVHLGGNAADMDTIQAIARKHNLPVVEDACQAVLAEWRNKKLGSMGKCGCFSFQASKNLNSGEGGAIITDDAAFAEECFSFHNNGRGTRKDGFGYTHGGANLRLTEFQAALLLTQMTRLEEQSRTREENAQYLTKQLQQIPGIKPARMYPGCTRNSYHLYMLRYDKEQFGGVPKARIIEALKAEGIPCMPGYSPLNKEPFLRKTFGSRAYQRIYGNDFVKTWESNNHCPENDRLCQEAIWLFQTQFLGGRSDMDQIAEAVRKVHANAGALAKMS